MLDIQGRKASRSGQGMHRRDFIRVGALGAMGLSMADLLKAKALGQTKEPKAKAVIQLWMGGGPTHLDTWDPKPEAGEEYCGPYKNPVQTNVPGIRICETLPLMAKQADKYSIIRSMVVGHNSHETATYIMQTGTMPSDLVYPATGAVVAYKKDEAGYEGSLPPYISLTSPFGRFSEAGFLGTKYKTFATGGSPHSSRFVVQGLGAPSGVSEERLKERRAVQKSVDSSYSTEMAGNKEFEAMDSYQERAYGLILGDAKRAFDLTEEKAELRDRYGLTHQGQACLAARRLVERGVPFVTVNWGGWDTHRDNFGAMKRLLPPLDQAFSALLEDLDQRGLLESTIVTWFGEFGRTPKIDPKPPWDGGRHHFGNCMSAVVAGGGFKGGMVVGESDEKGEEPKERPVRPWDLTASIYELMGIDPTGKLPHPRGCVAYVTPPAAGSMPSGGMLTEIM